MGPAPTDSNATCTGATLNVLGASLDWWYTQTYTYAESTFSVQFNPNDSATGWTLLPASTTFDVASAIAQPSCDLVATTGSYYNYPWFPGYSSAANGTYSNGTVNNWVTYTGYEYDCYSTPAPVAASTTVVSQTAHVKLNGTTGKGQIPNAAATPPPAKITVPGSNGSFSEGTPFVYFSAYEIMSKYPTRYGNGSTGCAETTKVYNMSHPFSFEYTGAHVNGLLEVGTGVTGDVDPAFLKAMGVESAEAGSWAAQPTVVIVVEKVLAAEAVNDTATVLDAGEATVSVSVVALELDGKP